MALCLVEGYETSIFVVLLSRSYFPLLRAQVVAVRTRFFWEGISESMLQDIQDLQKKVLLVLTII